MDGEIPVGGGPGPLATPDPQNPHSLGTTQPTTPLEGRGTGPQPVPNGRCLAGTLAASASPAGFSASAQGAPASHPRAGGTQSPPKGRPSVAGVMTTPRIGMVLSGPSRFPCRNHAGRRYREVHTVQAVQEIIQARTLERRQPCPALARRPWVGRPQLEEASRRVL